LTIFFDSLDEVTSKDDNCIGRTRFLSFGDKQVVETLTGYSSTVRSASTLLSPLAVEAEVRLSAGVQERYYSYTIVRITEGLLPGSFINYHARLSFKPVTDKNATFAEWFVVRAS
jgi:hypothetical protein